MLTRAANFPMIGVTINLRRFSDKAYSSYVQMLGRAVRTLSEETVSNHPYKHLFVHHIKNILSFFSLMLQNTLRYSPFRFTTLVLLFDVCENINNTNGLFKCLLMENGMNIEHGYIMQGDAHRRIFKLFIRKTTSADEEIRRNTRNNI